MVKKKVPPKPPSGKGRALSPQERARLMFKKSFDRECTEEHLAGLARARAWTLAHFEHSKESTRLLVAFRSVVREIVTKGAEAAALTPGPEFGTPSARLQHLAANWLGAVPAHEGAMSLATWVEVDEAYDRPGRYVSPPSEWGLWTEALKHWWSHDGGLFLYDGIDRSAHVALWVLAGWPAATWEAAKSRVREGMRHAEERQMTREQFQTVMDETIRKAIAVQGRGPEDVQRRGEQLREALGRRASQLREEAVQIMGGKSKG